MAHDTVSTPSIPKITVPAPAPRLAPRPQPWQEQLSVDLILSVLSRSIFHPFVTALLPVCLLALGHKPTATSVLYTTGYFLVLTSYQIFLTLSRRYAFGSCRKVNIEEEVVVITGGLNGLGRCIADTYALRGVSTVVLDIGIKQGEEGESAEGWIGYKCDVGNQAEVEAVWQRLVKEVGMPTVIINNAAVFDGRPFSELSMEEIERVYRINTFSHHHINSLFLPPLLASKKGGHIVTISSVLGYFGASRLSTYTASKAALIAFHTSLRSELAVSAPQIRTILVTSGELDTQMFAGLKQSRFQRFLGPVVEVKELAVRIVGMIERGEAGHISLPAYAEWSSVLDALPVGLKQMFRQVSGVDTAMTEAMVESRIRKGAL